MILKRLFLLVVMMFSSTAALATTDALMMKESSYTRTSNDLTIYGELGDSGGYYTYNGINYYNLTDIEFRYKVATYNQYYGASYVSYYSSCARDWERNGPLSISGSYTRVTGLSSPLNEGKMENGTTKFAHGTCPNTVYTISYFTSLDWFNPKTSTWDSSVTSYSSSEAVFTADSTPPRIESDIYSWEMALGASIPNLTSGVVVFDKFDDSPSISVDTSGVNRYKAGVYTITYTVTDKYGNTANINGSITVIDTKAPTLTVVRPHIYIRVDTNQWGYSASTMTNTSTPNWNSFVTCTDDDVTGCTLVNDIGSQVNWSSVNSGYQITYIYKDQSGNLAYANITIHVIDDTAPTIIDSDIYSWEMNIGEDIPDLTKGVTVFDQHGAPTTISVDTSKVNVNRAGVYTITYRVADKYNNVAYINGSITVNDITPPELTKNVDHIYIRVDTNEWGYSLNNMTNTGTPNWNSFITCTDDDELGCSLTNNIANQIDWNTVNAGYKVYYTFKDNSGNIITDFITVHVIDDTAPTIVDSDIYSWEMNIGEEIPDLITGVNLYDKWDTMPIISVDTSNINIYKAGTYTITYYVEDKYGNGAYIDGSITVNDITPPELSKNVDHIYIRVGTNEWGYTLDGMTYVTVPDWNSFITCVDDDEAGCFLVNDISSQIDWNTVNPGYQVIYIFSDESGNEISQSIVVHVIDDTAPDIENSDVLDEWIFNIGAEITEDMLKENIIVNDNADDGAYIDSVDFSSVNVNRAGSYTIYYHIKDASGNTVIFEGTITINDITPPSLDKIVNRIYIRVGTNEWGYSLDSIIYTDTPDWDSFIICTDDDERGCTLINDIEGQVDWNTLNSGYQIKYIYHDASGNEMTQTITVHVIDDIAPTIEKSDIDNWSFNIDTVITEDMLREGVTVVDDTDLNAYIEWIDFSSVNVRRAGEYIITYYIVDGSGNAGVAHGKVTIKDVVSPTLVREVTRIYIRVGTDMWGYSMDNIIYQGEPDWNSFVTCTDDDERGCTLINDISSQVNWGVVNSGFQVIYNFRDPSGHLVNQAVTVHVIDDVAPVVKVDKDIIVDIDDLEEYDWSQHLTITDNYYTNGFSIDVDLKDLVGVNANDSNIKNYVSYSVTDKDGNTTETGKIEITLKDTTAPDVELTDEFIYVLRTDSNHDFSKYIIDVTDNSGMKYEDFSIEYSNGGNGYLKNRAATIYIDITEINFDIPKNYNITYYVTDYSGNTYVSSGVIVTISNFAGDVSTIDTLVDDEGIYKFEYGSEWNIYQGVTAFDREGNSVISDVKVAMTYFDGENYYERETIDWSTLGRYSLVYYYVDEESQVGFVLGRRTIDIVDTQSPVLTGYFDIKMELGEELTSEFVLQGVTAIDGYDGDITANIEVIGLSTLSIGNNTITLSVEDSSGNNTTAAINVYVEARNTLSKYSLLLGVGGLAVVGGFVYVKSRSTAL